MTFSEAYWSLFWPVVAIQLTFNIGFMVTFAVIKAVLGIGEDK